MMLLKRAERTSHRRRNVSQIHALKVFGIFLSRNYFLPLLVFAFAFAMPIIMFLFNLENNAERSTVANYIVKKTKKDETIYVYDSTAKFIWIVVVNQLHNLFFQNSIQQNLAIKSYLRYTYPRFCTIYRCPRKHSLTFRC